ncbi:MAG: DUF3489 domain-containing protein [Sphingomicrobium sp.]
MRNTKKVDQAEPTVSPAAKTARTRSNSSGRNAVKAVEPVVGAAGQSAVQIAKVTKRDQLAALLVRDEGATLDQMIAATGWLPHTTRAALTGLKKLGYAIDSDKVDGIRTYRAVAPK